MRWMGLWALVVVVGCAAEEPDDGFAVRRVQDFEAPEEDGNLTAEERAAGDELRDRLIREHGQRPRRYNGLFNGSNEAERCFADLLAAITTFVNGRLQARGYDERLDAAMLATNFVTEGGYFVLDGNQMARIDGFGSLGIDTLVDNYRALKPYLHESVRTAIDSGERRQTSTNERGEQVQSLTDMRIDEGAWANAGMFAYSMALAASDMNDAAGLRGYCRRKGKTPNAAITNTNMATLPAWQQFFWTTVYFNAGAGTGKKLLCQNWLPFAQRRLEGDHSNLNALYNALWRTSTYRYMEGTIGSDFGAYCGRQHGSPCRCDFCATNAGCAACTSAEGCGWCAGRYVCTSASDRSCGRYITDATTCTDREHPPARPCENALGCWDCISMGCGFCAGTNTCMGGDSSGPFTGTCSSGWSATECQAGPCTVGSCTECLANPECGWCSAHGACGAGNDSGPSMGRCTDNAADWRRGDAAANCPATPDSCGPGQMWDAAANVCVPISAMCAAQSACDGCVGAGCEWCLDGSGGGHCSGWCSGSFYQSPEECASTACGNEGALCHGDASQCCPDMGLSCVGFTCVQCPAGSQTAAGGTCAPTDSNACCGELACAGKSSPTDTRCCFQPGFPCGGTQDCCGTMQCVMGLCACQTAGQPCVNSLDCCGGGICDAGRCS